MFFHITDRMEDHGVFMVTSTGCAQLVTWVRFMCTIVLWYLFIGTIAKNPATICFE